MSTMTSIKALRPCIADGSRLEADETADVSLAAANQLIGTGKAESAEPVVNVGAYKATLVQSGSDAPLATVLGQNDIGTIVWTRSTGGTFVGTKADAFPSGRTICHAPAIVPDADVSGALVADLSRATDATLLLHVRDPGGNLIDGFIGLLVHVEVTPA